jgi:hypothetical protein
MVESMNSYPDNRFWRRWDTDEEDIKAIVSDIRLLMSAGQGK